MRASGFAICLMLTLWAGSAAAQIPIIVPKVTFKVSAHLSVPAPGVLLVDDWHHRLIINDGVYWTVGRGDTWLRWHPHGALWVPVDPVGLPPHLVKLKLKPAKVRFVGPPGGSELKVRLDLKAKPHKRGGLHEGRGKAKRLKVKERDDW